MALGLAYDSDDARSLAAVITAIMTGEAYKTSSQIAARLGSFEGYDLNKEAMLSVLNAHREAILIFLSTRRSHLRFVLLLLRYGVM